MGIAGKLTNPGDFTPVDGENALTLALGVRVTRNEGIIIILLTGDGEIFPPVTVNNNPGSARYHRTLFRNLRRVLIQAGKWPYGSEGGKTEEEKRVG